MTKAKEEKPIIPVPGSLTHEFRLGDLVADKITGLEGTAIGRYYHVTGCDRFAVELPPKKGKLSEIMALDSSRIKLVKSRPEFHRDEIPDIHVELGDKVESLVSGVAGNCCIIHVPLYGAIQCDIQPPWDPKEKKMPDGYFCDAPFVKVIEPYRPRPAAETKPKKATAERGCSRMSQRGLNQR